MSKQQMRYPGTRPFSDAEQSLFFGREEDAEHLSKLILSEGVTVLYGKSGFGKSSLLNARIIPFLQDQKQFQCIVLRFYGFQKEARTDLAETLKKSVQKNFGLYPSEQEETSLLMILRQVQQKTGFARFLFILDQIEEIFDYPIRETERFAHILSDLVYNREFPGGKGSATIPPLDIHLLFSIRADRLSNLDRLSPWLPDIFKHTYELMPLSKSQAADAVITPALYARKDFTFECPRFYYDDGALDTILQFLMAGGKSQIEAFQLQIVCSNLEKRVIEHTDDFRNEVGQLEIRREHVENLQEVYENYYLNLLKKVAGQSDLLPLRRMVEEGLVFQGRRIPTDGEVLKDHYGVSQKHLNDLVDAHLLRRESTHSGAFSYEITHDAFINPISKSLQERREKEKMQQILDEQNSEKAKLEQEARDARNKRMRALGIIAVLTVLVLALAWQSFNLDREKKEADILLENIKTEKILSDSLKLVAEIRYNQLLSRPYVERGDNYLGLGSPRHYSNALSEFEKAYEIDSTNLRVKMLIDSLRRFKRE